MTMPASFDAVAVGAGGIRAANGTDMLKLTDVSATVKVLHEGPSVRRLYNTLETSLATAGAGTYLAAALAGGVILRDCAGASRVDTSDTAVAIIAAMGMTKDGDTFDCIVHNISNGAEVITFAGGTDVTGDAENLLQTCPRNVSARLIFRRTSATTLTMRVLGGEA